MVNAPVMETVEIQTNFQTRVLLYGHQAKLVKALD